MAANTEIVLSRTQINLHMQILSRPEANIYVLWTDSALKGTHHVQYRNYGIDEMVMGGNSKDSAEESDEDGDWR